MVTKQKVILSWSGGKDSALAFHELAKTQKYEIAALLTTISADYDRISMHGVQRILLEQQAESIGLPLEKVFISKNISNEEYESKMRNVMLKYLKAGISAVVFGDVFLEDLRKHRQGNLSKVGLEAIFPIWKKDTTKLAHEFIDLGFKAVVTCVDSNVLDKTFIGKNFDSKFLSRLLDTVDPCGENGEFHSFVYDGPIFKKAIPHTTGEIVLRENRFYYCDLIPQIPADKNTKPVKTEGPQNSRTTMKHRCPICRKVVKVSATEQTEKAKFFPFCSQRCRLIDLGAWLDAEYRVISKLPRNSSDTTNNKQ